MNNKYDVIIIGAGIGGLVCGCYLCKKGLKVLILEKQDKPGGYCTSFEKGGYSFDAAVHYFGSCREGGELNKILKDFSLEEKLQLIRIDPCDKIVMPKHTTFIRSDYKKTQNSFQKAFYAERRNIDKFFKFVLQKDFTKVYVNLIKHKFSDLLNDFFCDTKLKSTLSVLLGNVGLPASRASALTGTILFREYIFDPGYYPIKGIQAFPDLLAKRFSEYGGTLISSHEVKKIMYRQEKVYGITLDDNSHFLSDYIVSNIDALMTFENMLKTKNSVIANKLRNLKISPSAFVCYLKLSKEIMDRNITDSYVTWYFKTYDVDKCYNNPITPSSNCKINYLIFVNAVPNHKNLFLEKRNTMKIMLMANYSKKQKWIKNKHLLANKVLKESSHIITDIDKIGKIVSVATPYDFYRFTYNRNGAMYGWASDYRQVERSIFPQKTAVRNLFLAGHWTTGGLGQGGIPAVALSGRNAARMILFSKRCK